MKQRLRLLLNRSSIYLAVRFPHPLTVALMCRLNAMSTDVTIRRRGENHD
jgi:hypothetical protein